MTIEEFAHRCLLIKAGNATLEIPCCANCKYYIPSESDQAALNLFEFYKTHFKNKVWVVKEVKNKDGGIEFFCETTGEFISEERAAELEKENKEAALDSKYPDVKKWICDHPELSFTEDAELLMKPEDFCSRWEPRNEV